MALIPIQFDEAPGTILHDFQAMLDTIGTDGLRIAGEKGLFPIDHLVELDAKLTVPLKLNLKRPQLRSYPNIASLYMLLRSSGMGLIQKHKGAGTHLVLNQSVVERWQQLSPADRYWNLLGIWWVLAHEPGEHRWDHAFQDLRFAMEYLDSARQDDTMYGGWMPQYTLMAMFGMIRFSLLRKSQSEGEWDCKHKVLSIGRQLRALICDQDRFMNLARLHVDQSKSPAERLRLFRTQIADVAPQWQELLLSEPPRTEFSGTFTIKVSVQKAWRRIKLPADATLDELASAILDAFDFDEDHLYEFRIETPTGEITAYTHPMMDSGIPTSETELGTMGLSVGQGFVFHYDFGDDWLFDVKIEAMEDRRTKTIREIESHGQAPQQYPDWDQ